MTIPAQLLDMLLTSTLPVARKCSPDDAASQCVDPDTILTEEAYKRIFAEDRCAVDKLKEGIDAFTAETEKLSAILIEKWQ